MTVELDEVIRFGAITAAALAERSVHGNAFNAVAIHGEKNPVAVLIRHADVTMAFEIDGRQISLGEFERRFPGRRAEFERIAIVAPSRS